MPPVNIRENWKIMKLGEALLLRSDLQKRLQSIKARLSSNALVQEGEQPGESPETLLQRADVILQEYEALLLKINQANLSNALQNGTPLTGALASRDALLLKHSLLNQVVDAACGREQRYSLKEIKWIPTIDISETQDRLDEVARQIRDLNMQLQEANWRIEV